MPELADFEALPVDRQEEWTPAITVDSEPVEKRESYGVSAPAESNEQPELSSGEKIGLAREDLRGRETSLIEHQLRLLQKGKSDNAYTGILGKDLIKGIVGYNQIARELGDRESNLIDPEKSLLDISAYLDSVIDHDPRFNKEKGEAFTFKQAIKEQISSSIIGAKAEFAVADAFSNELGRQVFYPSEKPLDEDLFGVDWWVNMGRNPGEGKQSKRQVAGVQVKSGEMINSDKNKVVYPLPLNRDDQLFRSLNELEGLLGHNKLDRVLKSVEKLRGFTAAKYPTTHPALILLNPHDDIDHRTGVLEKHALHRLEHGMAEMLGR